MTIAITRTAWTDATLPDGSDGTAVNNAAKTALYDQIDAIFNGASVFALGGALALGRYTSTATGSVNDWDIDTDNSSVTVGILRCNNATALTITGIKAPSTERLLIVSAVGAANVTITHQDASSTTAGDRIITPAGVPVVLKAGSGVAALLYDTTTGRWRLFVIAPTQATVTLTDGATPALDASLGSVFRLAAAGDRTIAVPTNPAPGQRILIQHLASGGARTLALNTGAGGFRFGSTFASLSATASGKTDYIEAVYNDTDSKWDVTNVTKGF